MTRIAVGGRVPDFRLPATSGQEISLKALRGGAVVLYFYPRDHTSGCTAEGCDFRDHSAAFRAAGVTILGVSRDTVASHEKFRAKHDFPFDLLADEDEHLCQLFDVIRPKTLYGRKIVGIERSTFLIDARGVLRQEWRKVRVAGHATEVLEAARNL